MLFLHAVKAKITWHPGRFGFGTMLFLPISLFSGLERYWEKEDMFSTLIYIGFYSNSGNFSYLLIIFLHVSIDIFDH